MGSPYVLGFQTCALPIYRLVGQAGGPAPPARPARAPRLRAGRHARSEERRVGKKWRIWWAPYQSKKKKTGWGLLMCWDFRRVLFRSIVSSDKPVDRLHPPVPLELLAFGLAAT